MKFQKTLLAFKIPNVAFLLLKLANKLPKQEAF